MKLRKVVYVTLMCLFLVACGQSQQESQFNQSAEQTISSGRIKGQVDKENDVLEWLGVPYAQTERWKAPQAVEKWTETRDATKPGPQAIQYSNGQVSGEENALNLDIVRPNTDKEDLPVIVYLHGGNNQTGSAQEIKGNTFVNDLDAVYVSVNYRLGALGFNPLDALKTGSDAENSGNYTLLDVAAALDWVQENIETFGGDKENVTLAGFSAGGRDVMATLISPIFKGKYQKAISFSGGMTLSDEATSQATFASAIAPLLVQDGRFDNEDQAATWLLSDDSAVADYLKGLSADRLANLMGNAAIRMSVFPHLYKDGYVIPSQGFETETYNDVPLMLVTGTNEFSLFAAYDPRFMTEVTDGTLFDKPQELAAFDYVRNYGGELYRLSNGVDSARQMAGNYQSPIYIGEISYGDDASVTPDLARTYGAFHGVFEPLIQTPSNYSQLIGTAFDTAGAKELSNNFKAYLKQFIHSGDPNGTKLPMWTAWSKQDDVLSLSATKEKAEIQGRQDRETSQDVLAKMAADTTLSEDVKENLNTTVLNGRWFSGPIDQSQ